ncbi:hypothetical protein [Frateuria aurantia]|uniref:Uncharacterized protein n=1 Tax=Frateuria aurantia (strain ATCC 33424 / DSM 6220 / KCTC 2777 / LMG 1558 / NBRC 3245 / NCIMB 13370) TaxID=767434 RepID=H8KYC5_FRAAD|nr:hypothetical protein [Frateuria aurantia]AFC86929.1 hypothetical protein Fraau_2584 [Frateuria aurantia DSM 6220]
MFPARFLKPLLSSLLVLTAGMLDPLLAAAATPGPAESQVDQTMDRRLDQLFGNHQDYRDFFQHFQAAVLAGDKAKVAAAMHYPITVHMEGKQWTLYKPSEFTDVYAHVFTPSLIEMVRRQRYADLFANDQGVMLGQGAIWFSGICEDAECEKMPIRVVVLNLKAPN